MFGILSPASLYVKQDTALTNLEIARTALCIEPALDSGIAFLTDQITVRPIGRVFSSRAETVDDLWGNIVSTIELDSSLLSPESVQGLSDFSHLVMVYHFHKIEDDKVLWSAGHPRGNPTGPKSASSPSAKRPSQ